MSKDIKKKYIENQPKYVEKLFNTIFDEQNIKNLYKIFISLTIEDSSNRLSYSEWAKLYYRGIDKTYTSEYIRRKIVNINDWMEYLSNIDENIIFKYSYIYCNIKNENVKKEIMIFLKRIWIELSIILEQDSEKTPLLLL